MDELPLRGIRDQLVDRRAALPVGKVVDAAAVRGEVQRLAANSVTPPTGGIANYGAAILADAACPTCELWLHESIFHDPDPDADVAVHSHSEDEIIVVTGGEIVLGTRRYGRGTAIAVDRDTIYGFRPVPRG